MEKLKLYPMENRDEILKLDDAELSARCELEFFKGTGNGGQKRNKTSTAARVRLIGTDFVASDCTERSQHRNRALALAKLRMKIALTIRKFPAEPPERFNCAPAHPDYPLTVARLLDVLAEAGFDHRPAAEKLGVSPTALVKRLARDPELWNAVNEERRTAGRPPLHRP